MENLSLTIDKKFDIDKSLPAKTQKDRESFVLHLADTNLILAQRNAEWCGHGPILEQDIAITNISLDLLGQARNFYQYAAQIKGNGATEDLLAYLRGEREFKNGLIVELPRGDWAHSILRQFFCSAYFYLLYEHLQKSEDEHLSAIAEKAIKEVTYHLKWSSEWVIRLGDGTPESNTRMKKATDDLWMYTGEFFVAEDYETLIIGEGIMPLLKEAWLVKVKDIFGEATLTIPNDTYMQTGGKRGIHTEHLGFILAEMQYLQKTYPGAQW